MKDAFGRLLMVRYGAGRGLRNLCAVTVMTTGMASADELIITALGDSLTAGYGLATEDGLVPQLDRWLEEQGVAVDLRNAGVSGDTTAGGLSRVDWTLTPEVDAMIVALGGNDYLRGFDPEVSRENLTGILEAAKTKGVPVMLVGLRVGSNYGPAYKAKFEGMYSELAETYEVPLYPGFFDGMRAAVDGEVLTPFMQSDGIHPSAEGVGLIVGDLGPAVQDFAESLGE